MQKQEYTLEYGGKFLTVEFSDLAEQANGSVLVRYGDTTVLATAVMSKYPKDNFDFFPLTVDFEEKFYAAGKILGGRYFRREGRPTDEAVLSGRIVDRAIRPLFASHLRHEVQIVITVLSIGQDDPDVLAVLAASLSLGVSEIPWQGPVSALRLGLLTDRQEPVFNPSYDERAAPNFQADILACGNGRTINMIEIGAREAKEEDLLRALEAALPELGKLDDFQKMLIEKHGKEKLQIEAPPSPPGIAEIFAETAEKELAAALFAGAGSQKVAELGDRWLQIFAERIPETDLNLARSFWEDKVNQLLHREILEKERRPDGRRLDEIRPLFVKAGGLSRVIHGAGLFYRGGTHVLSVLTLGGPGDALSIDGMEFQTQKRFIHHYNFPPFSSGETGRIGGANRRMVGHGALVEKALLPVLPAKEEFPYTVRVVSECLSSNGSTSMASVCAATLALMDGGVPLRRPVAGIALGLMLDEASDRHKILTDIQGPEDHHGDMDFKIAGTTEGVTAAQMDVKVSGLPLAILAEVLERARLARQQIIQKIKAEIDKPRPQISVNAPRIILVQIKPQQIGLVIGSGGKTVNQIKELSGAEIEIEDDGSVFITGKNGAAEKAAELVKAVTKEYRPGEKCFGEIVKITDFGAFVRIGPNAEGLLHISEIAPERIDRIDRIFRIGDRIPVIIKEIDEKDRIKLSLKAIDPNFVRNKLANDGRNKDGTNSSRDQSA